MDFNIHTIAEKYVGERFPLASEPEKEKIIRDWEHKEKDAQLLVKDFIQRVGDPSSKTVLDAGCGNGGVSIAFWRAGAIPSGIDIEKELVDIAQKQKELYKADTASFYLYDGYVMPFADNTFDYAVSLSVLEHTTDPVFYLKEILRTLKPGGVLYLGFPNKVWPKETHTGLWFLTYIPAPLRPYVVSLFKKNPLEENNLHFYGYLNMKRMIARASGVSSWELIEEKGTSQNIIKKAIKQLLGSMGISYKMFLPHILVILRKK